MTQDDPILPPPVIDHTVGCEFSTQTSIAISIKTNYRTLNIVSGPSRKCPRGLDQAPGNV